jgi:hypothetical protein
VQTDQLLRFPRTRPCRKERLGFESVEASCSEHEQPEAEMIAEPPLPVATRSGRVVSKPKHFTEYAPTSDVIALGKKTSGVEGPMHPQQQYF